MSVDNDPENRLFKQIETQKEEQEAEKQRVMSEELHQKLKDFGVVAGIWESKRPMMESDEIPEIDSLIEKSLKRVIMKHDAFVPEREN